MINNIFLNILCIIMCIILLTSCDSNRGKVISTIDGNNINSRNNNDSVNTEFINDSVKTNDANTYNEAEIIHSYNMNDDIIFELFDFAIDNNQRMFIADKERIFIRYEDDNSNNQKKIKEFDFSLKFCRYIAIGNDVLYALDDKTNALKAFTLNGALIEEYDIDKGSYIKMECKNKKAFVLFGDVNDISKSYVIIYDLENKKKKQLDSNNIMYFSLYKDNTILVLDWSDHINPTFFVYDYEKNENVSEYPLLFNHQIFFYNFYDDMIYYPTEGNINRYSLGSNTVDTIYSDQEANFHKILFNNKMCYVCDMKNEQIIKFNIDTISTNISKNINIICYDKNIKNNSRIKTALKLFKRSNPNINFNFTYIDIFDYESVLNIKFMARESDFGIYFLRPDYIEPYVRNGTYEDLSQDASINKSFCYAFKGVKELCSYKEEIIGVPYNISLNAWGVNDNLLKQLGLPCPEGKWTWEQFFEYARQARKDLNNDGILDTYIKEARMPYSIPLWLEEYESKYMNILEKKADYNNELFINLLNMWKKVLDEGLVREVTGKIFILKDNILFYDEYVMCKPLEPK